MQLKNNVTQEARTGSNIGRRSATAGKSRYYKPMKRLCVIAVLIAFACLTQIAQSQVLIVPPSVTSLAPGRQFLPGPSVTSLGPRGFDNVPVLLGNRNFHQRHFFNGRGVRSGFATIGSGPIFVPYPVPAYPMYSEPESVPAVSPETSQTYVPDANYDGEYVLVRPRQLGAERYAPRPEPQPAPSPTPAASASLQPTHNVEPQPSTVLVFKDGHKLEINNYVIQGKTLFNLGDNGPRKISLADLDLSATEAENDNNGVEFSLP